MDPVVVPVVDVASCAVCSWIVHGRGKVLGLVAQGVVECVSEGTGGNSCHLSPHPCAAAALTPPSLFSHNPHPLHNRPRVFVPW